MAGFSEDFNAASGQVVVPHVCRFLLRNEFSAESQLLRRLSRRPTSEWFLKICDSLKSNVKHRDCRQGFMTWTIFFPVAITDMWFQSFGITATAVAISHSRLSLDCRWWLKCCLYSFARPTGLYWLSLRNPNSRFSRLRWLFSLSPIFQCKFFA